VTDDNAAGCVHGAAQAPSVSDPHHYPYDPSMSTPEPPPNPYGGPVPFAPYVPREPDPVPPHVVDPRTPQQQAWQQGYPQPAYPQQGYAQQGYPQNTYWQPPYPHPGYGYPAYGWARQAYAKPEKRPQSAFARGLGWILVLVSALAIGAAVLPWMRVDGSTVLGVQDVDPIDGDGLAVIVIVAPVIVLGVLRGLFRRGAGTSLAAAIVAVVVGALVAITGFFDIGEIHGTAGAALEAGPALTGVVGCLMALAGVVGIVRRR
jgi:hypothetical protein